MDKTASNQENTVLIVIHKDMSMSKYSGRTKVIQVKINMADEYTIDEIKEVIEDFRKGSKNEH